MRVSPSWSFSVTAHVITPGIGSSFKLASVRYGLVAFGFVMLIFRSC